MQVKNAENSMVLQAYIKFRMDISPTVNHDFFLTVHGQFKFNRIELWLSDDNLTL